jgi:hypothetical protein
MPHPPGTGSFDVPDDWEMRVRVDVIEPAAFKAGPKAPGPKTNLVMNRRTTSASLKEEIDRFKEALEANVEGIELLPTERFKFNDGTSGFKLEVVLPAKPPATQIQVFRLDGSVITTFTATCAKGDRPRIAQLVAIMRSFKP